MRNSIDYPGERAPRCPAVIAQAGYTGQNHFSVTYGDQKVTVRAEDGYAALFTAAKHWGYKFTRPEYHQNARATKLHYTPDTRPGALVCGLYVTPARISRTLRLTGWKSRATS